MFVCAELDGTVCVAWASHVGLFPALTLAEGATLGAAVIGVWVVGFAIGYARRVLAGY